MTRMILFLAISLLVASCFPETSKLKISTIKKNKSDSAIGAARITSIEVINNQLVITGSNLESVTNVKVNDSVADETFSIESKTATQIIANSIRAFSFDVSKFFNLILSDANASATFAIDFSLCNATLNGKGFSCATPVADKDVLSYDAVSGKWKPRPASGLNYIGTFDASSNPGAGPAIQPAGAYYVISDDGTIAAVNFSAGDWLVSNGSTWQKIDNSSAVLSVHGRYGTITALKGDYTLDLLADVSFPTPPVANQILKFDGTNWIPGDLAAVVESDPTVKPYAKLSLPTCAAGEVLKADGTSFSCVTDSLGAFSGTANRIVTTNASGVLAVTTITDTVLGYLSGVTSNIQTQIDSKLNWAISGLETIHPSRLNLTAPNAGKAVITDGSGFISVSPTTSTQLGYLSTATSNVQTQIDDLVTAKADMTNVAQTITALGITGLAAPGAGSDATNKTYVDTAITNNGVWAKGASSSINYMAGNVGIGTVTPNTTLYINSASATTMPLGFTTPIESYGMGSSARGMYTPAGTVLGINTSTSGVVGGALIDILARNATGNATNVFLGAVAGTVNNGAANFVIGRRVTTFNWTESMRVDENGKVGIGTSIPDGMLSVQPPQYAIGTASQAGNIITGVGTTFTAAMVGSPFIFANGVHAGTVTAFTDASTLTVSSSQTVVAQAYSIKYSGFNVSTSGSVGIGTTTPNAKLEISSTSPSMRITNPNVIIPDFTAAGFSPALSANTTAQWVNYGNTSGGYQLSGFTKAGASTGVPAAIVGYHGDVAPTTAAVLLTGYKWNGTTSRAVLGPSEIVTQIANGATPVMTVLGSGNVGIGTTTPNNRLVVTDGVTPQVSVAGVTPLISAQGLGAAYFMGKDLTNGIEFMFGTSTLGVAWAGSTSNHNFQLRTNNIPRVSVDTSGNLGIGVTAPTAKLEVAGTTKLGTDGVSFSSMGGCIIASTAISTTATTYTCTGVPATTAVAVNCTGSAAMTTPGTNAVYCRPTGTLDSLTCNTTLANSVAMTWNCMWMKM